MASDWRAQLAALPCPKARAAFLCGITPASPVEFREHMDAWFTAVEDGLTELGGRLRREQPETYHDLPPFVPALASLDTALEVHADPWAAGY